MSVPKWRRDTHESGTKKGWLDVIIAAEKLLKHTIQKVNGASGRAYFPKSETFTKRIPLLQKAEKVYHDLRKANFIRVRDRRDYERRHDLQIEALLAVEDIYAYLTIYNEEKPIVHLEYWVGLVYDTERLIKAWAKSDEERYYEKVNSADE